MPYGSNPKIEELAVAVDALLVNTGVTIPPPPDPLGAGQPAVPTVAEQINQAVSQLAGVPDYAAVANTKKSMRNEKLKERVEELFQLFEDFKMSVATTPALQPLQDQVDALTSSLQAISIATSTTAVSARSVGATATAALTASGTTTISDPANRSNTVLQLTTLLLKTNTLPTVTDASTTITVTSTVGTTTTPVLSKTILLAALPVVGNVLDILGNNGTTNNVYIPVGATLKFSASKGNFDFTAVLGIVTPTPAS